MTDVNKIAETIQTLPTVLGALLAPFDHETLATRPAPGEWCPLEVIGHLIACDSGAFRDRIEAIVAGEPDIPGFEPWEAINAQNFAGQPLDTLLHELASEREISAELLRSLKPAELTKSASFHDGRRFEANDFVHEWPFHDQEHLQQILDALKLSYLPDMTTNMRDALTS
jgi:hypothetical protein